MRPITIIGGGLAGLTLGIGLRQRDVPVTLYEAGKYPRHRVCGEFISGRGQESLARLGLNKLLSDAGAVNAISAAFFSETKTSNPQPLPSKAICFSRFDLDHLLAKEFRRLGGDLHEDERRNDSGEGVVRATGRRLAEDRNVRWFGLKIHARNTALTADLEMHLSPRGYVGLCRINRNEVNVCGLFRKRDGDDAVNARELLRGSAGSPLHQRLAVAEFDDNSFCAVAGLSLQPQRAGERPELCIGDTITMIPPVTGNGMSMAFESAELAIEPLLSWSRGQVSWEQARQEISHRCDIAFARRLAWAKWLQQAMLTPALQNPLISLTTCSSWFWRMAFEKTR